MDRQIFRPEAFGALADGSTNDAAAFWQDQIENGQEENER